MRQGSSSSTVLRHPRTSDSQSTLNMSIEDLNKRHSADDDRPFSSLLRERIDSSSSSFMSSAVSTANTSHTSHSTNHVRKAKSSMFSRLRTRSRSALRADALEAEHPSLRAPPPPIPDRDASFFPLVPLTTSGSSPFLLKKPDKKKKKSSSGGTQPPSPDNDTPGKPNVFSLDTNIDQMEGIVNLDTLHSSALTSTSTASPPSSFPPQGYSYHEHSPPSLNLEFSSPSSGFESPSRLSLSLSDHSSSFYNTYYSPITSADFSNPFLPGSASAAAKRKGIQPRVKDKDRDKQSISPTQVLSDRPLPSVPAGIGSRWPDKTDWMPPESWAVEKDDGEEPAAGESSSSEDSVSGTGTKRLSNVPPHANPVCATNTDTTTNTAAFATHFNSHPIPTTPPPPYPVPLSCPHTSPRASPHASPQASPPVPRRKRTHPSGANAKQRGSVQTNAKPMQIRIYRANNAFHIATIAPHVSVASLTPALNERLLQGKDVETHKLYLKERGRGGWSVVSFFMMLIVLYREDTWTDGEAGGHCEEEGRASGL
jgi:adenylate cyclase